MAKTVNPLVELDEALWSTAEKADEECGTEMVRLAEAPARLVERKSRIAGFTVVETVSEENGGAAQGLEERRSRLREARAKAESLKMQLREHKIEPLAVLPQKTWEALCHEGDLYRFEALSADGKTVCFNPFISYFNALGLATVQALTILALMHFMAVTSTVAALGFAIIVPAVSLLMALDWDKPDIKESAFLFGLLCVATPEAFVFGMSVSNSLTVRVIAITVSNLIWMMVTAYLLQGYETFLKEHPKPIFRVLFKLLPKRTIARLLWPDRIDSKTMNAEERSSVMVTFPSPPSEVTAVLRKAQDAGYNLCVAAVADAVTVDPDSYAEFFTEELKRDPIVYVVDEGQVAVIAQFGELPVEKEILRRIAGVDFLN